MYEQQGRRHARITTQAWSRARLWRRPCSPSRRAGTLSVAVRYTLEFGALPTAVACARLHARNLLWEWGLDWLAPGVAVLVGALIGPARTAPRVASPRLHARNLLWEWGLDWLAPDVELLVAELMAHAVTATVVRDEAAVR